MPKKPYGVMIDSAGHYSTPGYLRLTFDKSVHQSVNIIGSSSQDIYAYDEIQFNENK